MTTNPLLPFDYCRCTNEECTRKNDCLRYLAKDDKGYWIPFSSNLCGEDTETFPMIVLNIK